MAHPSAVASLATLRRAIAAVLRGGPLPKRDRAVVHRLILDSRTGVRLLIGARVSVVDIDAAQAASAGLAAHGIEIDADTLLQVLRYSVLCADPFARTPGVLSAKALQRNHEDNARELARAPLAPWTRGLLHMLGATIEDVPVAQERAA